MPSDGRAGSRAQIQAIAAIVIAIGRAMKRRKDLLERDDQAVRDRSWRVSGDLVGKSRYRCSYSISKTQRTCAILLSVRGDSSEDSANEAVRLIGLAIAKSPIETRPPDRNRHNPIKHGLHKQEDCGKTRQGIERPQGEEGPQGGRERHGTDGAYTIDGKQQVAPFALVFTPRAGLSRKASISRKLKIARVEGEQGIREQNFT